MRASAIWPDRGGALAFLELERPARQFQAAAAERDRAGGHHQHVAALAMQLGDIGRERLQPRRAHLALGLVDQQRRADLDDDAAEIFQRGAFHQRSFAAGGPPAQAAGGGPATTWLFRRSGRSVVMPAKWPGGMPMNRREFIAGSLAVVGRGAQAGPAWAQSGPLTRIIFPFAAGGSGDMLCRQFAQYLPAAARPQFHCREPHRRRRADRHSRGEGRSPRQQPPSW